jgi:RNA polymerase sigma factor (sigma-70 family)
MADDAPARYAGGAFPPTQLSILVAARSADEDVRRAAWERLVAAYWKPVYKYLRLKCRIDPGEAEDLTQEFFTRAMEKGYFESYDPRKARFRTFVRVCLDGFVANERKAARRLKRGGAREIVPLDFQTAEGEVRHIEPAVPADLDAFFHQEWVRSVFGLALAALKRRAAGSGRTTHYALFERYDLYGPDAERRPTYKELAAEHNLSVSDVTNYLAAIRRDFRTLVLDTLRELSASDEEFRSEAQQLLGVDPR